MTSAPDKSDPTEDPAQEGRKEAEPEQEDRKDEVPAQESKKEKYVYSYDDAVELTGHGSYNYLLLAACCLINFTIGMDMFGISVITTAAKCDLKLTIYSTGLLNSTSMAGIVLFGIPWGFYADRAGRKRALMITTIGGFVFEVLSSFSPTWQTMLVLKFVGSSFSSASLTLSVTYLGEGIGCQRRCRYLFIMFSCNLIAEFFLYGLALIILPMKFSLPIPWLEIKLRSWRLYNLLLGSFIGLNALLLFGLYESPKLLASIGKSEEALKVLNKIYRRNGGKEDYPVKVLTVKVEDVSLVGDTIWKTLLKQLRSLFTPPLLWRTLQLYFLLSACVSTNNVFLLWYPTIVNIFFKSVAENDASQNFCERVSSNMRKNIGKTHTQPAHYVCDDSISSSTIYAGILLGLTFGGLTLASSAVATHRKVLLIASYFVSGLSLILVNIIKQPVMIVVAFTLIQMTAIGMSSTNSYFVDLYPTSSRGLVTSLAVIAMRLAAISGINLVGHLIVDHCLLTFNCWAVYVASAIVVALFLPSDKKRYK